MNLKWIEERIDVPTFLQELLQDLGIQPGGTKASPDLLNELKKRINIRRN